MKEFLSLSESKQSIQAINFTILISKSSDRSLNTKPATERKHEPDILVNLVHHRFPTSLEASRWAFTNTRWALPYQAACYAIECGAQEEEKT